MIEKRLVQCYASDAGVDLDIAEREIKCWETHYAFDPTAFLDGLPDGNYDWADLNRLVHPDALVAASDILREVQQAYAFLCELTEGEARLASDPYGREQQVYRQLAQSL